MSVFRMMPSGELRLGRLYILVRLITKLILAQYITWGYNAMKLYNWCYTGLTQGQKI